VLILLSEYWYFSAVHMLQKLPSIVTKMELDFLWRTAAAVFQVELLDLSTSDGSRETTTLSRTMILSWKVMTVLF